MKPRKESWNMVSLTVDVEWAHPEVLADTFSLFEQSGASVTYFCTHDGIEVPSGCERAIHPNFRRRGDTMGRLSATLSVSEMPEAEIYSRVVGLTKSFCPEAIGTRSHSLFYDSDLLPVLQNNGLSYDSSCFLPFATGLAPVRKEHNIVELPIFYMDHHDIQESASGFHRRAIEPDAPGIRVFDFHPVLLYLNARTVQDYEAARPFFRSPDALLRRRNGGRGVRTLVSELLESLYRTGKRPMLARDIDAAFRRAEATCN